VELESTYNAAIVCLSKYFKNKTLYPIKSRAHSVINNKIHYLVKIRVLAVIVKHKTYYPINIKDLLVIKKNAHYLKDTGIFSYH
jgi:hypothetical protein